MLCLRAGHAKLLSVNSPIQMNCEKCVEMGEEFFAGGGKWNSIFNERPGPCRARFSLVVVHVLRAASRAGERRGPRGPGRCDALAAVAGGAAARARRSPGAVEASILKISH